ncbi:MAG: hypothetical protein OHK0031_12850 [Anaerolineales bacterium]
MLPKPNSNKNETPEVKHQAPPPQFIGPRKAQNLTPFIIGGLAILLALTGIILLAAWLGGGKSGGFNLFASATPTPTQTFTPTNTSTPTSTPTETATPTVTFTPTPSAPFEYVVQDGDYLFSIVEKFNLGDNGLTLILLLNPPVPAEQRSDPLRPGIDPTTLSIFVGQKLTIPNPGMPLPTSTPVDLGSLARGFKISYTIQPGDTLEGIAAKFLSTVEAIMKENNIAASNAIQAYQIILVPVNLVTPTNTQAPTVTLGATITPPAAAPSATPTVKP